MDVTSETLSEIVCSVCEGYLSCSPVYLTHDGQGICGHCYDPKTSAPAIRNKHYEAMARNARFPCKNRDLGCRATQPFSESLQEKPHELACEYRQYICPIIENGHCDWLGKRSQLLEHCRKKHPDQVIENSYSLTHDISKTSVKNYLLTAFEMLFLLHTKVCSTSGKIYHAVRFIGDPDKVRMFTYVLKVKRDNFVLTRPGSVAPQGCLAIQEDSSIALDINSLLHVLDGFSGASFIVIVQKVEEEEDYDSTKCVNCNFDIVPTVNADGTNNDYLWKCPKCNGYVRACCFRSEGCKFKDYDYKAEKHECYFCPYQKDCYIGETCDNKITDNFQTHYICMHGDITHLNGSMFRVSKGWWKKAILLTNLSTDLMVCEYLFEDTKFKFHVESGLRSNHLKEYKCNIRIKSVNTSSSRTYVAKLSLEEFWDWEVKVTKEQMPFWSNEFDIQVNIIKVDYSKYALGW